VHVMSKWPQSALAIRRLPVCLRNMENVKSRMYVWTVLTKTDWNLWWPPGQIVILVIVKSILKRESYIEIEIWIKFGQHCFRHPHQARSQGDWGTNPLSMEKFLHFARVFEKKYQTPPNFFHTKILKIHPSWLLRWPTYMPNSDNN